MLACHFRACIMTARPPRWGGLLEWSACEVRFVAIDDQLQRQVMGRFATGVTVGTTGRAPDFSGLTANAVASLSLNPPLVLVAVEKKAHSHAYMTESRCFAINILSLEQEALSKRFARHGPKEFSDLEITTA